jgi:hypothetical protein
MTPILSAVLADHPLIPSMTLPTEDVVHPLMIILEKAVEEEWTTGRRQ